MGENSRVFSKFQTRRRLKWAEAVVERNRRGELERRQSWRARAAARAVATMECRGKKRVRGKREREREKSGKEERKGKKDWGNIYKSLCFLIVLFVNNFLNFYFFFGLDLDRFVLGRTFCHTK
jgi:hypothetical protein